jgi:hypothetical protein
MMTAGLLLLALSVADGTVAVRTLFGWPCIDADDRRCDVVILPGQGTNNEQF